MNAIKAARYMAEYWKYYAEKKGIKALLALNKALDILGLKDKPKEPSEPIAVEPENDTAGEQRNGHLYAFDATRTKTQRQRDNDAAIELIRKVDSGEISADSLTSADKALLAKYSGNGGGIKGADGKVGSAHEYYTPKDVAAEMWAALEGMGFSGGRVLDPCSGSGVFGATSPSNTLVDNVELDYTSAKVNELVNGKTGYTVKNMPFEAYAAQTDDNVFDAVCTNVPFAPKANRAFKNDDKKYQNATLHGYFILRALDKLKYGGLAAFIVPTAVLEGKGKDEKLRLATAFKAEFLGAYRLPNKVFELGATGADVATDIIFFRKYSKEATERIEELQTSNPAILTEANVLREDFLKGRWFKLAEHKKFIFGEERQVEDQRWGGIVTKVINEQSISNIAKGIKPFGASAINWELLEAAESSPIVYTEGDVINQNGQTFEYRDGEFFPVAVSSNEAESEANDVVDKLETPYRAFMDGVTYDRAAAALAYLKQTDNMFGIPQWSNEAVAAVAAVAENKQAKQWRLILSALSVKSMLEENSGEPFDYLSAYPELSEAMKERAAADKALPIDLRNVVAAMKAHYNKKDGYSLVWQGKNEAAAKEYTTEQRVEALKYNTNSLVMGLDDMKEIDPSFNIITNDDYICSADGNHIMRVDDYFSGNVAAVLRDLDARIENAANDDIRAKLSRMKATAMQRVTIRDVSKLQFDLRSPFITLEEKAFWIENMTAHPKPTVTIIDRELKIEHNGGTGKDELTSKHKLLKRLGMYIRNGQLSLGGDSLKLYKDDGTEMNDKEKGVFGREFIFELNTRFDIWVRSNRAIQDRLEKAANDPENLYFDRVEDNAPLAIEGMNNDDWKLHGYQASWVRQQAREFGGINAYGVGLGKTFSALSAVQYAHSVGTKKKTLFVLPKNVFSNWHKEINGNENRAGCYTRETASRCLWVGVDFDKGFNYKSSNNARDLNRILENQHDKVFMTYETFKSIPMTEETVEQYLAYMRKSDKAFAENELKAKDEKSEARLADLVALFTTRDKNEASPKFEMMGFDSIVIDEAHAMKNGKQVFEFGANTKGLGTINSPSALALDTLAKTWYIRGKNDVRNDGVLALTATPITNSPLEIYTMLTLAKGEDFVKSQVLGVDGADGFMKAVCRIENVEDVNIEGKYVGTDMLTGLNNVELLRGVLRGAAEIKNAKDVALAAFVPEGNEEKVSIQCPDKLKADLDLQIKDYNFARQYVKEDYPITYGDRNIMNHSEAAAIALAISNRYKQPIEQVGQPFSLIHKMNVMLTDPELYDGGTFYKFDDENREAVEKAVSDFNKKEYKEKTNRISKYTDRANVVKELVKKDEDGNVRSIEYTVKITAEVDDVENRVVIDSTDFGIISKFEDLLEKHQADVDVNSTVKFAAMIANMKNENAHIRADQKQAAKGYAKQIVFNEHLGSHFKLKRLIAKEVGVPTGKIQFISGAAETADAKKYDILETQNGFNEAGEENKYCVIIANEKAEVGINLQIGCQAIHHLNIRWTPDSITQRNGRGQRQGNITEKVNIYYYEADGTFDMYRRSLVNSKASWIDSLMSGDSTSVDMSNMTNEQLAQVIDTMGNGGDLDSLMKAKDEAEKAAQIKQHKARQVLAIKNIKSARRWLSLNGSPQGFLENEIFKLTEQLKRFITQGNKVLKCFETGASPKSFGNNLNTLKGIAALVNEGIIRMKGAFSDKASHFDVIEVAERYGDYLGVYSDGKDAEGKIEVRNGIDKWVKTAVSYYQVLDNYQGKQVKTEGLSLAEKSYTAERQMYEDQISGARKQLDAMAANDKDGYGYGQKAIDDAIDGEMFEVDGEMMVEGMPVIVDNSKMGFITLIQKIGWGSDKGKHNVRVMQSDLQEDGKYKLNSVSYTAENTQNIRYLNSPDAEDMVLEDLAKGVIDMGEDHYLSERVIKNYPRVREFFPESYQAPIYFDLSQNTLKSPLFPLVISDTSGVAVLERMKAKQDELIGEVTYINSSTLRFERGAEYIGNNSFGREALLNILIENGMELPNGVPSGLLDSAFYHYGLSTRLHVGDIFDAYMKNASEFNDGHVYQSSKEIYEQKMKERVLLSDGKSKVVGLNEKQAAVLGFMMAIADVVNDIGVKSANFNPNLIVAGMDTSNVYLEALGGSRYRVESVSNMVSRLKERWNEETKVKIGGYVNLVGNTYPLNQKVGIKKVCTDNDFEYGFSGDGRKIGGKIDYDKIKGVEFAPKSWVIESAAWDYIKSIASPDLLNGVQAIEL